MWFFVTGNFIISGTLACAGSLPCPYVTSQLPPSGRPCLGGDY